MNSPYEILGVSVDATESEIKQARRTLLFDLHSDRLPKDLPDGAARLIKERVLEINSAYEQIQKEREGKYESIKNDDARKKTQSTNKTGYGTQNEASAKKENKQSVDDARKGGGKAEGKTNADGAGGVALKIIGTLIGIFLMQMCNNREQNTSPVGSYEEKVETITTANTDYCPELVAGIEQQNPGSDLTLKMLSEMRRRAPKDSRYKNRVEDVILRLKDERGESGEKLGDDIKKLFVDYLPLVCKGELHLAKQKSKMGEYYTETATENSLALEMFANAMCEAMKNNEKMDTVDARRAVGAIYMGAEMDKVPESKREEIRLEINEQMKNKEWLDQALVGFVNKCPDYAHRIIEN
jgi:hypothetical protein